MRDIPQMESDLHDAMSDLINVKLNAQSLINNQNTYRIPTYPLNYYYGKQNLHYTLFFSQIVLFN